MILTEGDEIAFTITVHALKPEPKQYLVGVKVRGKQDKFYACGTNNSIGAIVARLCKECEVTARPRSSIGSEHAASIREVAGSNPAEGATQLKSA